MYRVPFTDRYVFRPMWWCAPFTSSLYRIAAQLLDVRLETHQYYSEHEHVLATASYTVEASLRFDRKTAAFLDLLSYYNWP